MRSQGACRNARKRFRCREPLDVFEIAGAGQPSAAVLAAQPPGIEEGLGVVAHEIAAREAARLPVELKRGRLRYEPINRFPIIRIRCDADHTLRQ
jgi:hypothetical protein